MDPKRRLPMESNEPPRTLQEWQFTPRMGCCWSHWRYERTDEEGEQNPTKLFKNMVWGLYCTTAIPGTEILRRIFNAYQPGSRWVHRVRFLKVLMSGSSYPEHRSLPTKYMDCAWTIDYLSTNKDAFHGHRCSSYMVQAHTPAIRFTHVVAGAYKS